MLRSIVVLVLLACTPSFASEIVTVETANFTVFAESEQLATTVGELAEAERKRCAEYWFGHDVPAWGERCKISVGSSRGVQYVFSEGEAYGFEFGLGGSKEGTFEDVAGNISHVLIVRDWQFIPPRWAEAAIGTIDEGRKSRKRRRRGVRAAVADDTALSIRALFEISNYPHNNGQSMFDQSVTVAEFLLKRADRATFLEFIERGVRRGWDQALQRYYGFKDCDELETARVAWLEKR